MLNPMGIMKSTRSIVTICPNLITESISVIMPRALRQLLRLKMITILNPMDVTTARIVAIPVRIQVTMKFSKNTLIRRFPEDIFETEPYLGVLIKFNY